MKFSWIAVALATAIRLWTGPHPWTAVALAILAAIAWLFSHLERRALSPSAPVRRAESRSLQMAVAAVILLLVAVVDAALLWRTQSLSHAFAQRMNEHLGHDVADLRRHIASLERELDASAARIAHGTAGKENDRGALFLLVASEISETGRGARILDRSGEPVAWWGEDYRAAADRSYQFDVTNLYVTRSRTTDRFTIQAFARISNIAGRLPEMHPDDSWVTSMFFHGGFPRPERDVRRFLVSKRPDSSLWIDVVPRLPIDVIEASRAEGVSASAILLAIGALLVLAIRGRESRPLTAVLALIVARVALLPTSAPNDPLHLFDFTLYGSKVLGPFTKSPLDLVLTAAAFLGIVYFLRPLLLRTPLVVRALIAIAAAWGYIRLIDNFVANARISAIPDHVMPASLVQGVLFTAVLLFAITVVTLAATVFQRIRIDNTILRVVVMSLAVAAIVYVPLDIFGRAGARRFVAETYAPLVAGESGQLRTMITTTLQGKFSRIDLATLLPDDYRHMNMEDLAYALWLSSDLSRWRVPAVITIHDEFTRSAISRFGVGLPQFDDQSTTPEEELQVGSVRWSLLHHNFDVTVMGTTIGLGSIHVVNPADPGAAPSADIYRDIFDTDSDEQALLQQQRDPAVYDAEGKTLSAVTYRLPQSPARYFARMKVGQGMWVQSSDAEAGALYLRRGENALYAFPLQVPTTAQTVRRAGGVAVWALVLLVAGVVWVSLPHLLALLRKRPLRLDFRARTSIYLTAVVIVPLIAFVLFVRAYLANPSMPNTSSAARRRSTRGSA